MKFKKSILIIFLSILISFAIWAGDFKLDSSIFGDIKARNIGPAVMSGRVTDIQCVTDNPDIIYIGTAGGGLWKSKDRGIKFEPIFDKYTMAVSCITIDKKNPDTLWVGTGETNMRNSVSVGTGLYRTTDGGKNWKFMGFGDSERIGKVVIDPRDSNIIYVAVTGHLWNSHKTRGVYKSVDNGKTWNRLLYIDENTGCIDLDVDPKKPDTLFAAMWEFRRKPYFFTSGGKGCGFFKTTDGGKTWKKIKKGLPEGDLGRIDFDIFPANPDIIYAIVESKETALYKSGDNGESWAVAGTGFGLKMRPFYLACIRVDPMDSKRLYNPGFILSTSKNGGKSFESSMMSFSGMTVHPDMHAIWINPNDPKHLLLATDGGVYVSFNRGESFRHLTNLPVSQFYHVSYDLEVPYNVYGGLQDNGSWYGPSNVLGGGHILNRDWKEVGFGDGFYVYRDREDKDILFYSWQGGMLQRVNERTAEDAGIKPLPSESEPPYRFNWNAAVSISPTNKKTLYFGAQFLFKSMDKGKNWQKISPDLTTNDPEKQQQHKSGGLTLDNTTAENHCTIISICESPLDENIIWVGTDDGNLQLTTDGGKKWKNLVKNIKGLPKCTWCPTVEAGHYDKGTAYVVFDGHRVGDMATYVYRSQDFGKTWASLTTGEIEGYAHVVREDIANPNLLFLGTEFGLYASFNRGKNWVHFKETLPKVAVRDIRIHPVEHDLILGTHGRGIYILDDITPLRHIGEDVFQKDVVLLPARPSMISPPGMPFGGRSLGGDTEYLGENPPPGATITYFLKKRHIFGEFKLEVLNPEGEVIKTLPTGKRRGINRVFWDMALKAPKAGTSPGLSGMVFGGPMVATGIYTVRLTKNKKVYESKIELQPNRLAAHSPEDRQLRHKALWQTYSLLEHMAYISDTLNEVQSTIEKILKEEDKKLSRKAKKYLKNQIETARGIRGNIIDPKGNIYGSGELQGRMIEIYSSINGYLGRPTESQLKYIESLEKSLKKIEDQFGKFIKSNLEKINGLLKSQQVKEIKLLTEEEYMKEAKKD
jgi:photosystem II stability/assembly factor-like uncharacterized protein